MKHVETTIQGASWNAEHAPEKQETFILSIDKDGTEKVLLDGVAVSALNECDALTEKVKRHDLMEDFGYTVESKSIIPFGVEPVLARKFEYYLNTIRITTDIRLRRATPISYFNVDDLRLIGNWSRFAVVAPDDNGDFPNSLSWIDISAKSNILWESHKIFSFIIFESVNGARLEIGTGFDLWRWNVAPALNATGQFSLEKREDGTLALKRSVLSFDTETEIPGREWRFHWYLAWSSAPPAKTEECSQNEIKAFPPPGKKPERVTNDQKDLIFSLQETQWPEPARISRNGNFLTFPCMHSKMARNHIRKVIRSIAANSGETLKTLSILGCTPHFCNSSTHLEGAKKEHSEHWDISDILNFHFWASRKLKEKNVVLKIIAPSGGIFAELPSFISMG